MKKEPGTDYEVTIKVRNNRILSRVRALGFPTMASFCRAHDLSPQKVSGLITMRTPAMDSRGEWYSVVLQLARVLDIDPRDLFTQRQMAGEVRSTVVRHVDEEDLLSFGSPETRMLTSDYNLENDLGRQLAVDKVLDTLNPRERRIVIRKFGLDGDPAFTYEELARRLGVTAARVQQIEARALRKLKHPSRADILRPYAVSDD